VKSTRWNPLQVRLTSEQRCTELSYTFYWKLPCECSKEIVSSNTILKSKFEVHMKHSKELATLFVFARSLWTLKFIGEFQLEIDFGVWHFKQISISLAVKMEKGLTQDDTRIFAGGKACVWPLKNEITRLPIGFRLNHLAHGWYTLEKEFSLIWAHRERKQAVNNNLNNTN